MTQETPTAPAGFVIPKPPLDEAGKDAVIAELQALTGEAGKDLAVKRIMEQLLAKGYSLEEVIDLLASALEKSLDYKGKGDKKAPTLTQDQVHNFTVGLDQVALHAKLQGKTPALEQKLSKTASLQRLNDMANAREQATTAKEAGKLGKKGQQR